MSPPGEELFKQREQRFNDIVALKEKMLLLLRDDALRARFSAAAREDILRDASIERMFSGFRGCVTALTDPQSALCAPRFRRVGTTNPH